MINSLEVVSWKQQRNFTRNIPLSIAAVPSLESRPSIYYRYIKRGVDIVLSLLALILLSPLLLLIALAIKLDSPGPVLYVQKRLGLNGKTFSFYKFRSMYNDKDHTAIHRKFAHDFINGFYPATDNGHGGLIFKPPGEQNSITRVGRLLRKASLDELPQLINVIKGEMSLVGPRPNMDYELEYYKDWHKQRLSVLPGLTGLSQVRGRSRLRFDEIVELDIQYIENVSFWLDMEIILRTIPALLTGDGAG